MKTISKILLCYILLLKTANGQPAVCVMTYPDNPSYHQITYSCVKQLMYNYLNEQQLSVISEHTPVSGYISLEEIIRTVSSDKDYKDYNSKSDLKSNLLDYLAANKDRHRAIRFFIGYNKRPFAKDDFFVSMKYASDYDPDASCCHCPDIEDEYLYRSDNECYYTEERTEEGIDSFLNEMRDNNTLRFKTERGYRIRFYADEFLHSFLVDGTPTNEERCGVFKYEELEQLIRQRTAIGFRFFLGYDYMDHPRNKIRLILIAVNAAGENILEDPDHPGQEAMFLEKSWPPFKK